MSISVLFTNDVIARSVAQGVVESRSDHVLHPRPLTAFPVIHPRLPLRSFFKVHAVGTARQKRVGLVHRGDTVGLESLGRVRAEGERVVLEEQGGTEINDDNCTCVQSWHKTSMCISKFVHWAEVSPKKKRSNMLPNYTM